MVTIFYIVTCIVMDGGRVVLDTQIGVNNPAGLTVEEVGIKASDQAIKNFLEERRPSSKQEPPSKEEVTSVIEPTVEELKGTEHWIG